MKKKIICERCGKDALDLRTYNPSNDRQYVHKFEIKNLGPFGKVREVTEACYIKAGNLV
jgi:hypothetical protein